MNYITLKEVEFVAFTLAQETLSFNEPIPGFTTRFPNILESCLATPFQTFTRKALYPGLVSRASFLFYLLIKNHPFQNGNKRIAMTTLLVFLYKNKKWIEVDTKELYNFTVWVAESQPLFKDETVSAIKKFLRKHLVALDK